MPTIKEYIWNGSGYVELDAGTVDGRDSLEFETADPEIQNHIKTPHASVATVNSNRADIDVIKNSGYLKGVDGIEFEHVNNTIDAQLLGGNPPEHYAVKSEVDLAIGQLQEDLENIDVSWDGITGKPTTFAPATHLHSEYMQNGNAQAYNNYASGFTDHAQLAWNHGNIIVQTPTASGTPMISFHSQGATAVGLYEDSCKLYTTGSDGRSGKRLLDIDDYNSLFQSVVSGKQSVVTAINDSLGYTSGLTTSNTHDDYAWWIQNKVALVNTIVKKQAATNTAALIVALTKTLYHSVSIAAKTTVSSSVTFTEPCLLYITSKNRNSGGTVFDSVTVPDNTNLLKGPDLTVYSYNTANLVSILAPCTITFSIYNGETNTKTVSNIYKVTV